MEKQGREPRFAKEPYFSKDPSIHNISFLMCVECFRNEHDFVSGLCWLNIRENRKKDLQLEKLQKKYILSSSKRQTLLRRPCVGICFLVKKKMAELGRSVKHEREMKAAEQAIMQVSNNMTTGYHAGNMKAYESYQDRFVL